MTGAVSSPGHDRCGAKKRQGDGTCRRPRGWGTTHAGTGHCKLHGGSTAVHRAAAVKQQASDALARLDVAPVSDPLTALAEIAGQVVAWKDQIAAKVNLLTSIRYSTEGGEQLRSEVALFERAMDRCTTTLVAIAKLNIDERLARVNEQQAQQLERAVDAMFAEIGLPEQQRQEARSVLARQLRPVS